MTYTTTVSTFLLGISFIMSTAFAMFPAVYVDVEQGTLMGETVHFDETDFDKKIDVFKGVPYADPPRRFEPPRRRRRWGEWDATRYRAVCPQSPQPSADSFVEEFEVSEDCLYLNVFAPHGKDDLSPVMVFIHGGGFVVGTSMVSDLSGVPLAAIGEVVVVTMNYRLGVLGFLDTGDEKASGNYGLLDQAMAMSWVRTNIEAFGGDSSRITLFGVSAGSASVHCHMVSDFSKGLFDQAIMQSGAATAEWSFQDADRATKSKEAFAIGDAVGCDTRDMTELIGCLRDVHWYAVHNASIAVGYRARPSVDGVFLTDSPKRLMERGEMKQCPIMTGFTRDEGSLYMFFRFIAHAYGDRPFVNRTVFYQSLQHMFHTTNIGGSSLLKDAILQQYMNWSEIGNNDYDYYETLSAIAGDNSFGCPTMNIARTQALMTSHPVFLYQMTHVPTTSYRAGVSWLGAGHGEDIRFVFGYCFIPGVKELRGPMTEEEVALTTKFIRFWSNFAKSGDPSREDSSSSPGVGEWAWPAYTVSDLWYKELSLELPVRRGLKANECAFWNDYLPKLQLYLGSQDKVEQDWRDEFNSWQDDLKDWRSAFRKYERDNSCI